MTNSRPYPVATQIESLVVTEVVTEPQQRREESTVAVCFPMLSKSTSYESKDVSTFMKRTSAAEQRALPGAWNVRCIAIARFEAPLNPAGLLNRA